MPNQAWPDLTPQFSRPSRWQCSYHPLRWTEIRRHTGFSIPEPMKGSTRVCLVPYGMIRILKYLKASNRWMHSLEAQNNHFIVLHRILSHSYIHFLKVELVWDTVSRESKGYFIGITLCQVTSLYVMGCAVSGAKYPILARFPICQEDPCEWTFKILHSWLMTMLS